MDKRIYLSPPHLSGDEIKYINQAIEENWIAPLGPNVNGFENDICSYTGRSHALALSSGTSAIHLALKYLGVGEGDIVFCSSLTFAASCNPIMYEKAEPVFIDSNVSTYNMCPKSLKKAFNFYFKKNQLPKAVIVVNLYGQSADMDPIIELCNQYNVPVIEDSAESLGATYKGKSSGTFGKFSIFSFNGNKIITTSGGGMLVSDNKKAIDKSRFWATQARDNAIHYEHSEVGYNYRMSNICAGIGRGQMKVLDQRVKRKKEIYNFYKKNLNHIKEIEFMNIANFGEPNYWLTVINIDSTSSVKPIDIINLLSDNNIEARPVWKPMHLQPLYKNAQYFYDEKDVSKQLFESGVCLPSGTSMLLEEQKTIINLIQSLF